MAEARLQTWGHGLHSKNVIADDMWWKKSEDLIMYNLIYFILQPLLQEENDWTVDKPAHC